MTIEQLRLFSYLCRIRNFTRTAEQLFMTQEGLSYQIRQMEKELGYPLFVRNHKQVALTSAGERWQAAADAMLLLYDKTALAVQESLNTSACSLSVSLFGFESPSMLEVLTAFQAECPRVRFQLMTETSGNLVQMLREMKTDLLYAGRELLNHSTLGFAQTGTYCNGFVLRRDHPLANRPSIDWKDVDQQTMVLPAIMTSDAVQQPYMDFQLVLMQKCPGAKLLYAPDFSSTLTMVELGMGIFPTAFDVRQAGKPIGINCIQIPRSPIHQSQIGFFYHKENPKQAVRDLLHFIDRLNAPSSADA